jgi:quinol monooxygenase YgiN
MPQAGAGEDEIMLIIQGWVRVPPGSLDAARPAMRAMVEASRAEPGCLAYAYAEDALEPGLIHVIERWSDEAALKAHFQTAHMAAWRAEFPKLGITGRDLTLFDAANPRPI